MTSKERRHYREMLNAHEQYNGMDYLRREEEKALREELKADRGRGAFALLGSNGRAVVIPTKGGYVLKSYYTEVAKVIDGEFYKIWYGYSATTLKHINLFRAALNMGTLSKREWVEMGHTE